MKTKQIIIVSLAALIASFAIVKADTIYSLPQWLLYNGFLKPVVTSSMLQVPSLATSTANTCVTTNASGTFSLAPCGSGGGGSSTIINGLTSGNITIVGAGGTSVSSSTSPDTITVSSTDFSAFPDNSVVYTIGGVPTSQPGFNFYPGGTGDYMTVGGNRIPLAQGLMAGNCVYAVDANDIGTVGSPCIISGDNVSIFTNDAGYYNSSNFIDGASYWSPASLTNNNQLTNGSGYITTSTFNATGTAGYFTGWNAMGNGLTSTSSLYQTTSTGDLSIGSTTDTLGALNVYGGLNDFYTFPSTIATNTAVTGTTSTTIPLSTTTGYPSKGYVVMQSEILQYNGISGGALQNVVHAFFGTSAASHATGTAVQPIWDIRAQNTSSTPIFSEGTGFSGANNVQTFFGMIPSFSNGITFSTVNLKTTGIINAQGALSTNSTFSASGVSTLAGTTATTLAVGTTTQTDKFDVANASGTVALSVLSTSTPNNLFEVDNISSTPVFQISSSSAANLSGSVQFSGISSITTGNIGGSALLAGACSSATTSISSVFTTSTASVFTMPITYPGDGAFWESYISAPSVLTTKVCEAVAGTPATSTYNVKLIL